jgi:PIN domain nuclease of toxin-antitoxin system
MDLGVGRGGTGVQRAAEPEVILLDTNALIWLHQRDRRARGLEKNVTLYASPASLLELQILVEAGRLRLRSGFSVEQLLDDSRWLLDDPPSADWFSSAVEVGWTRDPFDRLLVAHAALRGWRLATGDTHLVTRLGSQRSLEL